ncbi:MAG: TetR/AcrR family transcriptional regulator C-terminal domain-containing protein, partial [Pyrinomonadaceae bacterium]
RLLLHSALESHQLFQMFWDRNVREMANFLCSYIRERQKAGAIREMEPLIASRAFTGMIVNHSMVNNLFDRTRNLLDISNERAAREFTDILLRGVGTSLIDSPAL